MFAPNTVGFYILVAAGTAVVLAIGRWVAMALKTSFIAGIRDEVAPAAQKAEERATVAAEHAEKVQTTIGDTNGHGDLMTMAARILTNQATQFDWQRDHDVKDDAMAATLRDTRGEVIALTDRVATLTEKVAALELTRPPFEQTADGGTG